MTAATQPLPRYFLCDLESERNALTGLNEGDLAYSKDTDSFAKATGSATWAAVGASTGAFTGPVSTTATAGSYGPELLPAISPANWGVGGGTDIVIGTGTITKNADGGAYVTSNNPIAVTPGRLYKLTFTVSGLTGGKLLLILGAVATKTQYTTSGTFTEYLTPLAVNTFVINCESTSRWTISALSVRLADNADGTGSFEGRLTAKSGITIPQSGGLNIGSPGLSRGGTGMAAPGLAIQNDSGPGILLEGAASAQGAGSKAGGGDQPVLAVTANYGSPAVTTIIAGNGQLKTVAYITIDGMYQANVDANGVYTQTRTGAVNVPGMFEIRTDVSASQVMHTGTNLDPIVFVDDTQGIWTAPTNRNYILSSAGQQFWAPPNGLSTVIGTPVASIAVTTGGSGCPATVGITVSGGGCSGVNAIGTSSGGVLQTVTLVENGRACTSAPSVTASGCAVAPTLTAALMDVGLGRGGVGELVLGLGDKTGVPIANTLRGPNATGTNLAGVDTTFQASLGTGTGAVGHLLFKAAAAAQASGTTQQTPVTHLSIGGGGVQWGSGTEPACNASARGSVVYVPGGAGVADTFRICVKNASDTYAYQALY